MNCELYEEDGVQHVVSDDSEDFALGLNPDTFELDVRAYSEIREVGSRDELIKRVEDPNRKGGQAHFDGSWTKHQNGWGKCASSAATYGVEKARYYSGQKQEPLADDYLYSLVNDGRDRGSTLAENMEAITNRGIARRVLVKEGDIYRGRARYDKTKADKDALRFRSHEAFRVNGEAEAVESVLNSGLLVHAIHVGRNWRRFDRDGVLRGDRGMGNHCEHCDDVRYNRQKGRFEFRKHSSHGRGYGEDGFCWITWGHMNNVHSSHRKYTVMGAIVDPFADQFEWDDEDDAPMESPVLTVASSAGCHWCVKWEQRDRARVEAAGVQVVKGDVPGRGVPRFRLEVGGQRKDQIGYWSAERILQTVGNLQASEVAGAILY